MLRRHESGIGKLLKAASIGILIQSLLVPLYGQDPPSGQPGSGEYNIQRGNSRVLASQFLLGLLKDE